jgi:hypothetical protein
MPPDDDLERMERPELIRLLKREHQRVLELEAELRKRHGAAPRFPKGREKDSRSVRAESRERETSHDAKNRRRAPAMKSKSRRSAWISVTVRSAARLWK